MAVKFAGSATIEALVTKVKAALALKLDKTSVVDSLTSTDKTKALSAAQGKVLSEKIGAAGKGDMLASKYDTDGDGKVNSAVSADTAGSAASASTATTATTAENAKKLGGKLPTDYLLSADMTELTSAEVETLWNGE